ncbi:Glycosyl hydrolases family 2, sugar binding domain [compost metagenome]
MQHQIDCEVVPVDILLDAATVRDGRLHVNLEDYACLVVPYAEALPAAMMKRLTELAGQGLPLRFVGGLPVRTSEGRDVTRELSYLANHPLVKVVTLEGLAHELRADGHYDIRAGSYEPYLRSYHYLHEGLDVFMFFNEDPAQSIQTRIVLPIEEEVVGYDAFRNRLVQLQVDKENGKSAVELSLQPYESIVLLSGADLADDAVLPLKPVGEAVELHGDWTVFTSAALQYPCFQEWGKLTALTNMSGQEYLPRFTGTFRYETEFEWNEASAPVLLELGEVYETAEVWINGEPAGVRICPPYRFEICGPVKQGTNKVTVEVTNTLVKEQPDFLSAFSQQEPSGLMGPVRLTRLINPRT